jgi:Fe-S-cluster-containing dehydrogenase component
MDLLGLHEDWVAEAWVYKCQSRRNAMSERNPDDIDRPAVINTSRRCFLKRSAQLAGGLALVSTIETIAVPKIVLAAEEKAPIKPEDRMKYLFAQRENCTGCRSCEYACSQYHEKGVVRPSVAKIHVKRFHGVVDVAVICWHCDDSPCVKACPTTPKAIAKDKDTNVIKYIDDKTCLGAKCNKCMEACPSQFLRRHPDTGWPMFCDLCDGDPHCVKACKAQAEDTAPVLRANKLGFGVNMAYRDVTPKEAAKALLVTQFYPNKDGERR